jgi:hypothetical protein
MQINSTTPAGIASTVWTNTARTLTGFGTALVNSFVARTSLASGNSLNILNVGANAVRMVTAVMDSATSTSINLYDATNAIPIHGVTGTNIWVQHALSVGSGSSTTNCIRLVNGDASAHNYMYSIADFIA